MVMPRPKGKALKIAKQTIPGLKSKSIKTQKEKKPEIRDEVETKIIDINEARGKFNDAQRKKYF